ncbi:MAG TPA: hypothetical protein VFI31_07285 [Pirellulales bacterium]|nr:hypothetical protein [Pirellulales bacterium]
MTLASGSLAINGIDMNANFYLELNTTGKEIKYTVPSGFPVPKEIKNGVVDIPAAASDVNGNVAAAGPHLLVYGNGDVTLAQAFDLNGNFDLQVTTAGLGADFNSKVTVPGLGSLNANGSLVVDAAGVTGYLSMGTPDLNPGNGFSLSGTFTLEVNTTDGPVTVGPANDLVVGGQVLVKASGDLNAGGLDLKGLFELTLNSSSLDVYAVGHVDVGSLGVLQFNSNLTISSDGVYGDMTLNEQTLSGYGFSIDGTTDIQLNTTDSPQGALAADAVRVHVAGSAQLEQSVFFFYDSFLVKGTFDLTVQSNGVNVVAAGTVVVGPLGTLSVNGDLTAMSGGLWGDLSIQATVLPHVSGFSLSGGMQLEVNTSASSQTVLAQPIDPATGAVAAAQNVTLPANTVDVAIGGTISLLDSFTLHGELDVQTVPGGGVKANLDANLSVFGITVTVSGSVSFRSDASVYGTVTVTAGGSDDLSFGAGAFTISAQADFSFDTEHRTAFFSLHGAPTSPYSNTYDPATVSFFGITASGYLTIDYSSGVTTINVPDITVSVPDPIQRAGASVWHNFFGNNGPFDPNAAFTFDASGSFQSDGQFKLTFGGEIGLGSGSFESGVGALGGYLITIGNYTGYVPTSYNLTYSGDWNGNDTYVPSIDSQYAVFSGFSAQVWAVGWVQDVGYGLMTGGVTIAQNYFDMHLWAAGHFGKLPLSAMALRLPRNSRLQIRSSAPGRSATCRCTRGTSTRSTSPPRASLARSTWAGRWQEWSRRPACASTPSPAPRPTFLPIWAGCSSLSLTGGRCSTTPRSTSKAACSTTAS